MLICRSYYDVGNVAAFRAAALQLPSSRQKVTYLVWN